MTSDSKAASDWQDLLRIAQGAALVIERVGSPRRESPSKAPLRCRNWPV